MKEKISILHISDLHRSKDSPITNSALIASLLNDKNKYTTSEKPLIKAPNIIIVCGDIIRGFASMDNSEEIQEQYSESVSFLTDLANNFLEGDKSRIVLIPGNHDVDWKFSKNSMAKIDNAKVVDSNNQLKMDYLKQAINQHSDIKWSWKELSFYKIEDRDIYYKRFKAFADFYHDFYDGERSYSLSPDSQYDIFDFAEFAISIIGYNSCYNNDHLNLVGDIHPDCIAKSTYKLRRLARNGRLLLAAWHHNTKGQPNDANYMDSNKLKNFIDVDIALGFHGHQHKTEIIQDYSNVIEEKRIVVFSAGTLCGGPGELPVGQNRQYNIIEIETDSENDKQMRVTLHAREKTHSSSFENPIWAQGSIDSINISYIITYIPKAAQTTATDDLFNIEVLISERKYEDAKKRLLKLDLRDSFVRKFLLESLAQTGDDDTICKIYNPPQSNEEAVYLLSSLFELNDKVKMRECLKHPSIKDSNDPAVKELRTKLGNYIS